MSIHAKPWVSYCTLEESLKSVVLLAQSSLHRMELYAPAGEGLVDENHADAAKTVIGAAC